RGADLEVVSAARDRCRLGRGELQTRGVGRGDAAGEGGDVVDHDGDRRPRQGRKVRVLPVQCAAVGVAVGVAAVSDHLPAGGDWAGDGDGPGGDQGQPLQSGAVDLVDADEVALVHRDVGRLEYGDVLGRLVDGGRGQQVPIEPIADLRRGGPGHDLRG